MTDTVRVPRAWLEAFRRDTDPTEPIADNGGTVWDMFCHEAIAMLAASPQGEGSSADTPVEAVAWVLPDELADLKDPRHPRQSLTIWGHRSWTGFVPLYTHPAPIKPSADTGELRERAARLNVLTEARRDGELLDPCSVECYEATVGDLRAILDLIQSERGSPIGQNDQPGLAFSDAGEP